MIKIDEDALICDLAETYGILDYRSQPLKLIAILAFGLRDESRIKMKIAGNPANKETLLLARISDQLTCAYWSKKEEKPLLITNMLFGIKEEKENDENDFVVFDSPEAFEQARKQILEKAVD